MEPSGKLRLIKSLNILQILLKLLFPRKPIQEPIQDGSVKKKKNLA
jgi:hypothetical protein